MDIFYTEALKIPGYSAVQYIHNPDHILYSQSNYPFDENTDISIRGWYDVDLMNQCNCIVAVWRVKKKFDIKPHFSLN